MTRTLWIRDPYLAQILRGEKRIEVRIGYPNIARLKVGDGIRLNDSLPARIRRIAHYRTFHQLLETEDPDETAPGTAKEELLTALHAIYPPGKESRGAVALELELTELTGD